MTRTLSKEESLIRPMVFSAYDMQKTRIAIGLRLCANLRAKLSREAAVIPPDEDGLLETIEEVEPAPHDVEDMAEIVLSEKAEKVIDKLKKDYRRLTDGIAKNRELPKKEGFIGEGLITEYAELQLIRAYLQLEKNERVIFEDIGLQLENIPIYSQYLKGVRGIGPAMASTIVTYFNPEMDRPSQWWAYAGLDIGPDGMGRSKKDSHLIDREYTAKDGSIKTKRSTTFNPVVQSRLIGAFAPCLIKCNSPFKVFYNNYKHRIETDPNRQKISVEEFKKLLAKAKADNNKEEEARIKKELWTNGRIHRAAVRYMLKMLLLEIWRQWRTLEGLPLIGTYDEVRRGYGHHARKEAAE